MYMQADTHSMGQRASFSSSPIPCSPQMCISFWYHMYGQGMKELVIIFECQLSVSLVCLGARSPLILRVCVYHVLLTKYLI